MNNKICCVFNLAPHYNAPIYKLMDEQLKCDFYIGDTVGVPIELMNYNELKGFKKILRFKKLWGNFYWQNNAVGVVFKKYQSYILSGEPYCISIWIILLLAKIMGKSTYLWSHGWHGNETSVRKYLKKIFFKLSSKVLLYGDYARELMIKEGFAGNRLICIYNSLDFKSQLEIFENLSLTNIYSSHFNNIFPTLIYIGRIQKSKKIDQLIEAIAHLQKNNISCNLVIIGESIDENNFKGTIDKYGLNAFVWLYGACYDEKIIGELLYNANVCVVPGDVGLTAIHSLTYGTPVISHNNFISQGPEFESIIPGITGDFFIQNSIPDLSGKIHKWISQDLEQRINLRQMCNKIIHEKYNPEKQIIVLKNLLNNSNQPTIN